MKYWMILILSASLFSLQAQTLIPSPAVLNFGDAFETDSDSLSLSLTNPLPYPVAVTDIRFYDTYSQADFWVQNSSFSIPANGSQTLWVYFQPRHNINYNSEMLILTDSHRGSVSVNLRGVGKYSLSYYNSTAGKSEQALKTSLKTLLGQGFVSLTYNSARDEMFMIIDNQKVNGQGAPVNTLESVYTGQTVTAYSNRSEAQNSGFNTEHVFPQSLFNQDLPMRADIHHLFPTDANSNSQRANLPFGTVSNPSWQQGGSKLGNGVFEPRDIQKGPTARAMMYFVIRYQDYSGFFNPQAGILRQWHEDYPPNAIDRRRNDDVAAAQGNRNPFVDYPQFAERINNFSGNSVEPISWGLDIAENELDFDTVGFPTQATYHLPLVNFGNQDIDLTLLSFAQGYFGFKSNSGNNTTIEAGEAHIIQIGPQSGAGLVLDTLIIGSNLPSPGNIKIPVRAFLDLSSPIEEEANKRFRIYPLPSKGSISIEGTEEKTRTIYRIYGQNGQLIKTGSWQGRGHQLRLQDMPDGLYTIRLTNGGHHQSSRILLQKTL